MLELAVGDRVREAMTKKHLGTTMVPKIQFGDRVRVSRVSRHFLKRTFSLQLSR
jgi:hypothetical protein